MNQFAFEIDIQGIVAKAMAPETIQPILEKAITKAFIDAVDDATGYRSEFRTKLKAQLGEALPHGLSINNVTKFQHLLNAAVASALHGANVETVNAAMAKVSTSVLPNVPARIKMSAFLKEARAGFHKDDHEAFYAYFEPSTYGDGGGLLYLNSEERPSTSRSYGEDRADWKYKASHRLAINNEGDIYSLKMDGTNITPKSRPNAVGSFERLLLSMYVGRTTMEIYMDDDDVREAASEQHDD